jgi:hypothetical protein
LGEDNPVGGMSSVAWAKLRQTADLVEAGTSSWKAGSPEMDTIGSVFNSTTVPISLAFGEE